MPQLCSSFPCGSSHGNILLCLMSILDNISELINQLMYLLAFSLRLTVSCSRDFNFINALSKIFPFSASSVTDSLPLAGLSNSLADFFYF